ncbi:MAG: phosphoribosyltransferase family protein [Patescibacteria group bacterium]
MEVLFPLSCALCGKKEGLALCVECGVALVRTRWSEDQLFSFFSYQNSDVQKLVHALKYEKYQAVGKRLGELVEEELTETLFETGQGYSEGEPIILLPIPLSHSRLRDRGFNQSLRIAEGVSETNPSTYRVESKVLYKIKDTESQVSVKDKQARLQNLKGTFTVRNKEKLAGKVVIIIDDVSTTGATMQEAFRAVSEGAPAKIVGVTFAH